MANNFAPDSKIPLFEESRDTGKFLAQNEKPSGKRVFGATGWYTPTEMMAAVEKVSGQKATFKSVPTHVFAGFLPPPLAKEIPETFDFIKDYHYYGSGAEEALTESLKVKPSSKI